MLRPRSIKSLTLEGILKLLCKQWFRRLTSGHNYVFLRFLLSINFAYYKCANKCVKYAQANPNVLIIQNKNMSQIQSIHFFLIFLFFFFTSKTSSSEEEVGGGVGSSSGIFFLSLLDFRVAGRINLLKDSSNSGRSFNGHISASLAACQDPSLLRVSLTPIFSPCQTP